MRRVMWRRVRAVQPAAPVLAGADALEADTVAAAARSRAPQTAMALEMLHGFQRAANGHRRAPTQPCVPSAGALGSLLPNALHVVAVHVITIVVAVPLLRCDPTLRRVCAILQEWHRFVEECGGDLDEAKWWELTL